jgi:hypothetical protein
MKNPRVAPMPIVIYLAGAIDSVTTEEAQAWREAVGEQAKGMICFFSPAHAYFGASKDTAWGIDRINRAVILGCDGVLANLAQGPAFGTIREIEVARQQRTPVVIVDPGGEYEDSLMTYDMAREESLESGLTKLLEKIAATREPQEHPMLGIMLEHPHQEDEQ